jgi:hypothetical protein
MRNESEPGTDPIVCRKVRWLAAATGCFTAVTGALGYGALFPIIPSFIVVGAVIQPRFPQLGRGLMLAGALLLTVFVLPYGVAILFSHGIIHDLDVAGLTLGSVLLVTFCDVAIVIEEVRIRRHITPG